MRTTSRYFSLAFLLLVSLGAKGGSVSLAELFDRIVASFVAIGMTLECAICVARQMLGMGGCG